MKDNIDKILDVVEYPDRYSDSEIDEMLCDSAARDFYSVMSKTCDALTDISEPDIDRAWSEFATVHFPAGKTGWGLLGFRPAASVAAIVVASLAVVAATIGLTHSLMNREETMPEITNGIVSTVDNAPRASDTIVTPGPLPDKTVVFRNESLEHILSELSKCYGASVIFKSDAVKGLHLYFRWDKSDSLAEVVEQLNSFDRIRIIANGTSITVE